jgi:hypothetical protein
MQSSPDEEAEEEQEEKSPTEENGYDVPVNSLLLIAIFKPSQKEVVDFESLPPKHLAN